MPSRTTLAQVNLLEYSNRICKTRTWIPGLVPLHESKVGPLGLGEPSMGEAWTHILGAFRGAWLEVASPTSPTEAVQPGQTRPSSPLVSWCLPNMYSVAEWLVGTMKELGKQLQNTPHSSRNLEDTGALYMLRGMLANGSQLQPPGS